MDYKEKGCRNVKWIELVTDDVKWWSSVIKVNIHIQLGTLALVARNGEN
jgi:hypothetical protein